MVPFSIYRRTGSGPFADHEVAFLWRVLPHLNRCLQVQLRLETAEGRGLAAALDCLSLAVILLGARVWVERWRVAPGG